MTVGQRVYELRREKGISQKTMADALGVTRQTVSKWENDLMPISEEKQKEITQFLNVAELTADDVAATHVSSTGFTANQKIVIAVITVILALSCTVTVIVGIVSFPNLWADEKGATSLYVDFGYFWLALGITLIIAGLEIFAVFAYKKENKSER